MKAQKKRLILAGAILCVILFAFTIITAIWNTYGGHNVRMAVAEYVEVNDGRWPKSWNDIEEYHSDPIFGCRSTMFVKRYWSVAWDIDPLKIMSTGSVDSSSQPVSVVYNNNRVSDPSNVKHWDLGKRITKYYREKKVAEQVVAPDS